MEVTKFYWYATEENFLEDELFRLDISAGRLRHRWVPLDRQSASLYLLERDEAAGMRAAQPRYTLVEIHLAEPIEDLSMDYPNATQPGLRGAVIRVPIKEVIPKVPTRRALERGVEQPPISFRVGLGTVVECTDPMQIASLEMGILSEEDVANMSVVEVLQAGAFQYNNPEDPESPIEQGVHELNGSPISEGNARLATSASPERTRKLLSGHWPHSAVRACSQVDVSRYLEVPCRQERPFA